MNQTIQSTPISIDLPTYQQAWEYVAGQLRGEISRGDFDTWVKPMRPLGYKGRVFTVGVFNAYARDWVKSRLKNRITQLLEGLFHEPLTLKLTVVNEFYQDEDVLSKMVVAEETPEAPSELDPAPKKEESGSQRKILLRRAYGSERAAIVQPERTMFVTNYFFSKWLPILGHSAMTVVLAARAKCFWNPMTNELRNIFDTDMSELAKSASVSVRTVKDVLANELIQKYFLRYRVRRVMTPNGIRTAGIILQVRMDDPLTPEDQLIHNLAEEERWYSAEFDTEEED